MTREFLKNILSVPNPSGGEGFLAECIQNWCRTAGVKCSKDGKGNLYLTKGSPKGFYPGMTAHLDSVIGVADGQKAAVDKAVAKKRLLEITDEGGKIKAKLDGNDVVVGCDDKNAVAIVLSMFERVPALKAALYVEEEVGMRGCQSSDFSFWDDVCWVLGFDSPGGNRATHSSSGVILYSDGFFQKYLEQPCKKHGITNFNHEPYTDIKIIREKTRLETFNCRNGGIGAHSTEEYADYDEVCDSEDLAYELLTSVPTDVRHLSDVSQRQYGYGYHSVGSGTGGSHWWRQFDRKAKARRDTDGCAVELKFRTSDMMLKFYEKIEEMGLELDAEDDTANSVTIQGELGDVKDAYAAYCSVLAGEDYESFDDLDERAPWAATSFWRMAEFPDDVKFTNSIFADDGEIDDAEYEMKDAEPKTKDGAGKPNPKNGESKRVKHGDYELGDELE